VDLTNLPSFDKKWLAVHTSAVAMLFSVAATSTSLLWHMSCENKNRRPLMKLSVDCFSHSLTIGSTLLPMVQSWLQRVNGKAHNQNQSRFMSTMLQACFVATSMRLGLNAYEVPSTSYALILVKVQTVGAA
jgi:hypothetical protein